MKKHIWKTGLAALILSLGSVGMVQAETIPPHGEGQIGLQAVVLCEELSVRQDPSASSKAVETLKYGDRIIVQPQTGGWASCFLSDSVDAGPAGWVDEEYLAIDPAWYRTDDKTRVYAWNDTEAPRIALLDKNTTLPILKDEGEWIIVSLRSATGWIHRQNYTAQATASGSGRKNGERFEDTIMIEGMNETVRYEHIVNNAIGIEMDYDYECFVRHTEADRERFTSCFSVRDYSPNYLEVRYSEESAEATTASISAELSKEYDIEIMPYTLVRAGDCVAIEASGVKGRNETADTLQTVYIIPAGDGCVVAAARYTFESADGFGTRMHYLANTISIINGQAK